MDASVDEPQPEKKKGWSPLAIVALVLGVLFFLGICVVALLAALLAPALMTAKQKGLETACRNNLKQVALAAVQYADDKRFFPYVAGAKGGEALDLLVKFNYVDNPEVFSCPLDEGHARYAGFRVRASLNASSQTPLVWCRNAHRDGKRHVAYPDCRVEPCDEASFREMLAKLQASSKE
jgi:hypothetical protein